MAQNIGNTFIEQSFAMILIFCAVVFDVIIIITFIFSLFYDLGAFDVIGEIINITIAPLTFGIILFLMSASKYALKKTEQTLAPVEDQTPKTSNKKNLEENTVDEKKTEGGKNNEKKELPSTDKNNTAQKTSNPAAQAMQGESTKNSSAGSEAKAAGKQAAQEAAKGGLKAGGELAQGEVTQAAKTTAKTGLKITWILIVLGITLLLKAIPYSEAIPWYTIWAVYVWFKITAAELKNI